MKKVLSICIFFSLLACNDKDPVWIVTTPDEAWKEQDNRKIELVDVEQPDVEVMLSEPRQVVDGFGACFNELGWTSLSLLSDVQRDSVFSELFAPGKGANFNICRMPVGANDFSRDWYSYNETAGDFEMKNFSIDNDKQTLVPFIKEALKYNPKLALWASPWSPPAWMKDNGHYACVSLSDFFDQRFRTDIRPDQVRAEGMNMFITEDEYYKAYALYFQKFIESYRGEGIDISMVMPQNEFNSCQPFPSCTWQANALAVFVGKYLGPAMQKLGVDVMFGTMERPNPALVDTILTDPDCAKYVKGVGFQWAGKESLPNIHERYPNMKIYETEQECGNGANSWGGAVYSWGLMKHYFKHGTNTYDYWNISLLEGGMSRWGWAQNSLVVVDSLTHSYRYTYEYQVLKHASHFVRPGAKYLPVSGDFSDIMAFLNPDGGVVVIVYNSEMEEVKKTVKIGTKTIALPLKPQSFNTIAL
ncbi:MAG: beta-glycosidase [Dysgonamonadaceae bacterium]|jgi:glucosylceramidase|nr:beta-glycosidase [Dysgonamonadaceae bacterium]